MREVLQTSQAPQATAVPAAPRGGVLQRKCACGGTPGPSGECAECRRKRLGLQRQARGPAGTGDLPPAVHEVLDRPGRPLDPATRTTMERRFGHDFGQVRVHTGQQAATSARAVDALAYTVGRDVVFDAGHYAPRTPDGQRLLAHELTHVVQQRSGAFRAPGIALAHSRWERDADRVADAVARGEPAPPIPQAPVRQLAREKINHRSETVAQPSGEVTVTQWVTAGVCQTIPETRRRATGDITARRSFFEARYCRGGFAAEAEGELDTSDIIDRFADLLSRLPNVRDPQQALDEFQRAVRQATPRAEVNFALQFRTFRAELRGTAEGNIAEGLTGELTGILRYSNGQFRIEFTGSHRQLFGQLQRNQVSTLQLNTDIGPVEVRLQGSRALESEGGGSRETLRFDGAVRFRLPSGTSIGPGVNVEQVTPPGGERTTQVIISLRVELGDRVPRVRDPDCTTCACDLPQIEYRCEERPPAGPAPEPPPVRQTVYVPLFFEYADVIPRPGWEQRYEAMLRHAVGLIREGYRVARIEGRTSPEGPLRQRRGGRFEGNIRLAQRRAEEAQRDLVEAINQALAGTLLIMRDAATIRQRLESARSGYPVEGIAPGGTAESAELFGTRGGEEVSERQMFSHLSTALQAPAAGEPDPLEAEHVTGAGLPESVQGEVGADVEAFRTGRRGEQALSESERLQTVYRLFRRALIVLEPPPPPPPDLTAPIRLSREQLEQIVGTPIPCTEAHQRVFADRPIPKDWLFEDRCR